MTTTTKPEFTPGPWLIRIGELYGSESWLMAGNRTVATMTLGWSGDNERERLANARLLVEAPELYKLLAAARRQIAAGSLATRIDRALARVLGVA